MISRRRLFIFLVSTLCLVTAYVLRKPIYDFVIVPLAYVWWLITLYYHVLPQLVIWILLIYVIFYTGLRGVLMDIPVSKTIFVRRQRAKGPVETLSLLVSKNSKGVYYKWLIANRLGRVARDLLDQRDGLQAKRKFARLSGRGWNPPEDVSAYLESGVNGSFADYPHKGWSTPRTPLDINPQQVIEYLESEMENNRNGHR